MSRRGASQRGRTFTNVSGCQQKHDKEHKMMIALYKNAQQQLNFNPFDEIECDCSNTMKL